jgi:hypothetical protein
MNKNKFNELKKIVEKFKKQRNEELKIIRNREWNDIERDLAIQKRKKLNEELLQFGLEFQCTDYGHAYCLDLNGLAKVLEVIKK